MSIGTILIDNFLIELSKSVEKNFFYVYNLIVKFNKMYEREGGEIMEKKEPVKISLPLFITIIVLLVACVAGIFMFMQNQKLDKEIDSLKEQISKTQTEKNELQERLNDISKVASNTDDNEKDKEVATNNKTTFSNEQVKDCLSNYFDLRTEIGDSILKKLTEKGYLNYNPSETVNRDGTNDDGIAITKVKLSDYKKAMLNYVSEQEFNKTFSHDFTVNNNGYLTYNAEIGGPGVAYTVLSVTKKDDTSYTAKTLCDEAVGDEEPDVEENYTFTIKDYNGHCVIDSINEI